MRLHVAHPSTFRRDHPVERTDLVNRQVVGFLGCDRHLAATEAGQIRKPGMGADRDVVVQSGAHRSPHDGRVARVKPARDVRGRDQREDLEIGAQLIRAEALT